MKYVFIISVIFFINNELFASNPPDTMWTKTFGGTFIDIAHSVQITSDDGFIITGYTRSFGGQTGRRVWLIRTNSTGDMLWQNTYGGSNDDEGYDVKQTSDGGFIIAGHTKSFGAGGMDVFLIKTDSLGNQEWTRTFGGPQDDEGYSVVQTSDGGYLVAGATSSFGAGGRDIYLVRTNSMGNTIWTKTLGGLSSDGAWSIVQTSDGGYALAGWTFSHGPGPIGNAWLVKIDTAGNQQWHSWFGGTGVDRAHEVKQTSDGGYILTGYTSSSGAGLDDMLLVRTDSLGNLIWSKTFGGSGRDYGQSVIQTDVDGGFLVAGYTLSFGAGGEDMWLVRVDVNGNLVWQKTLGGSSADVAYSVQQTIDGGFIVAGYTLSFGAGVHDVWLVKIAPTGTLVSNPEISVSDFKIYQNFPNPFNPSTTISFDIPTSSYVQLVIYNMLGQKVRTLVNQKLQHGSHSATWDGMTDTGLQVPSGVYLYKLKSDNFSDTKKMILMK